MNKLELIDKKLSLRNQCEELINNAEVETRKLNSVEDQKLTELRKMMADVDAEIAKIDAELEAEKRNLDAEKKEIESRKNIQENTNMKSIVEEIRSRVNGEVSDMKFETRAFTVTGNPDSDGVGQNGGATVQTDVEPLLTPLRDNVVLGQFTWLTGLHGPVQLPAMGATVAKWKGENAAADQTDAVISSVTLSPKRLTTYAVISKSLLFQSTSNIEAVVREDIQNAVTQKLQSTLLGAGAGSADEPAGLFANPKVTGFTGTYNEIVDLEESVESANAIATGYIVNPSLKAQMRKELKDSAAGGYVFEDGEVLGMPTAVTMGSVGLLYGNLKDIVIGQFDSVNITVDPYSLAGNDEIKLVINAYFDFANRREGQGTVVAATV